MLAVTAGDGACGENSTPSDGATFCSGIVAQHRIEVGALSRSIDRGRTAAALEDARRAGLLDGEKTAHVGFRAPPALVEAAKREERYDFDDELGILALAMLAQSDPVAAVLEA